jgi:hypothetical protein
MLMLNSIMLSNANAQSPGSVYSLCTFHINAMQVTSVVRSGIRTLRHALAHSHHDTSAFAKVGAVTGPAEVMHVWPFHIATLLASILRMKTHKQIRNTGLARCLSDSTFIPITSCKCPHVKHWFSPRCCPKQCCHYICKLAILIPLT